MSAVSSARRAFALLLTRLLLVAGVTVIAWALVARLSGELSFPPNPMIAALSLLPVNVICLVIASRMLRAEGQSIRELVGYRHGALGRDIAWGILWLVVLFIPFIIGIMGTAFVLHGAETFDAFETMFYNPDAAAVIPSAAALVLGIVTFVTFAPLNAPTEEIVFRGYAQSRLSASWSPAAAIAVSSIAFGLQHAFFAPTVDAMAVYVVAFTLWGACSAIIVRRQGRLLPVIIAHVIVNVFTSAPAIVFPALMIAGVL